MVIDYCKNPNEQNMLLNLYKKKWNYGLKNKTTADARKDNNKSLERMARLTKDYAGWIKQENQKTIKEFSVSSTGKLDPKRHLKEVSSYIICYHVQNMIFNWIHLWFNYFNYFL